MNVPSLRPYGTLTSQVPEGFSRPEGRELVRSQNREISRGLIANTRVAAAGMVAANGLSMVGLLSREAAFQCGNDPATAARLNHIVDQFACMVGTEVARFGLGGGLR